MTEIRINGKQLTAMIDSGASGNFLSQRIADGLGFGIRKKEEPYNLTVVDGSPLPSGNGRVELETYPLPVAIHKHHEELTFDIVGMATHDVVLGMPWLKKHNPMINWKKQVLEFERCGCVTSIQPGHRQRSMADERKDPKKVEVCGTSSTTENIQEKKFDSVGIDRGQSSHETRVKEGSHVPSEFPEEYKEYNTLFQEELTAKALPKHQTWDHEIILEPGKQPTFGPIYILLEKEFTTLRKYLNKNLKKGFIFKLKLLTGYPI